MNMAPREFIDMAVAKEISITRNSKLTSKKGATGKPIDLIANYFPLKTVKDWDIFQYRVDFAPNIEDTRIRKGLVRQEKAKLPGNCFDGTMMFTVKRMTLRELVTKLPSSEETIQIKFQEVGLMSRTDQRFIQIYNIILNRAMSGLKLTQLGRNYYDSEAKASFSILFSYSYGYRFLGNALWAYHLWVHMNLRPSLIARRACRPL